MGLTAALLSLAGIPLTIGLIAKFYAVASGVDGRHAVLLGALVAGSIIGLCYYLRVVIAMAGSAAATSELRIRDAAGNTGRRLGHAVLAALVLLLIGLDVYPTPLLTLIRATASMVTR